MYKVVVVDDKKDVVEGIICMGDWVKLGCTICGKAYNGEEALSIIKEYKPHIVITDIRMPKMDGIELTKAIKELDDSIKVIILSGYDEFSYAQQAVKLGAEEYLLKPAQIHIISDAISRCIVKLDKEKEHKERKILRKQRLIQSLPLLRDDFFQILINEGESVDDRGLKEKMTFIKIPLCCERVILLLIDLDALQQLKKKGGKKEIELYKFGVKNLINDVLDDFCLGVTFSTQNNKIGLLINSDVASNIEGNYSRVKELAEAIRKTVKAYLDTTVTIAINQSIMHIKEISGVYNKLEENMSYKLFLGGNRIITEEHIKVHRDNEKAEYPKSLENELLLCIKHGEKDKIDDVATKYLFELIKSKTTSKSFKSKIIELMIQVGHISGTELETRELTQFKELYNFEDIKDYVKSYMLKQAKATVASYKTPIEKAVDRAKEYIHLHYAENINLQRTAEHVCMSPTYFSAVFKEFVNQSFIDYLISYRIEVAKELLLMGNYKIYEVAEKVGYSDRRYFSEVFKKHVGMKPKDYMKTNGNSKK